MASAAVRIELGESIPPLTPHAVSVSLPTWGSNVGYEEGKDWVLSKMKTGYPRFFIHKSIQALAELVVSKYGKPGECALLFPSASAAERCLSFFRSQNPQLGTHEARTLHLQPTLQCQKSFSAKFVSPQISAVLCPESQFGIGKTFWQHTGEGISSRRAEYCTQTLLEGGLEDSSPSQEEQWISKGPRRYQKPLPFEGSRPRSEDDAKPKGPGTNVDCEAYVEERFGRNLEISFASDAKLAIRRRIAGSLTLDVEVPDALKAPKDTEYVRDVPGFSEDDVYLYPCGMNAIYQAHRCLMEAGGARQSIMYGFPYIDTLKILEKFGPGALFYGNGTAEDLNDLERRLKAGEKYLALFCEFPGNPLLKSPDLERIRALADTYGFFVVVDETIGTFINVNVLPFADVVVSSLTKIFSGDANVMGGSAVLNPAGRNYQLLKSTWNEQYDDTFWSEDAIFLERNSRDFVSRIERINVNAEVICSLLLKHPQIKEVLYPKVNASRKFYDRCRTPKGGYGGLLSATFHNTADAIAFYDKLDTAKGPSLGTNITLSSPYVILAHYNELSWAATYGVEPDLVRFSVGLEDEKDLVATFSRALAAIDDR